MCMENILNWCLVAIKWINVSAHFCNILPCRGSNATCTLYTYANKIDQFIIAYRSLILMVIEPLFISSKCCLAELNTTKYWRVDNRRWQKCEFVCACACVCRVLHSSGQSINNSIIQILCMLDWGLFAYRPENIPKTKLY